MHTTKYGSYHSGNENDIIQMNELLDNSSTLSSMGFAVNVGSVVWNQCKDILTNDETKTRLIYSSDIVDIWFSQELSFTD